MRPIELARRYYESYETGDRPFVEQILAEISHSPAPLMMASGARNISRAAGRTMSAIANYISRR